MNEVNTNLYEVRSWEEPRRGIICVSFTEQLPKGRNGLNRKRGFMLTLSEEFIENSLMELAPGQEYPISEIYVQIGGDALRVHLPEDKHPYPL